MWVEVGTRFVRRKGRVAEVVSVFRDVTDRKRKEVQLSHLATLVDSFPDAIIGSNRDGMITSWNAGAERLYGYQAEEVIGQPFSMILPACRPDGVDALWAKLTRNEGAEQLGTVHRRKDGTLLDVCMRLVPIRDFSGRFIGASLIAQHGRDPKDAGRSVSRPLPVGVAVELACSTGQQFVEN